MPLALELRAQGSGPFSDTKTPMTLEKSVYFPEFSDHSEFPSRLNSPALKAQLARKLAGQSDQIKLHSK